VAQDRQADVAARQRGHPGTVQHMRDQCGDGRFAVGTGNADDFVRGQVVPRLGEQLDVADDGHMGFLCVRGDRVAVEWHARRDDGAGKADEIDRQRIADVGAQGHRLVARVFAVVPCGDARAAGDERLDGREARARQPQHRIAATGKGARGDHRIFKVASPASARTIETIQKRMTTVDSGQPNCSK